MLKYPHKLMTHILIINQHGENRGDEAAMRAMLASFEKQLPDVTFTLLYQFRDRTLRMKFKEQVEDLPIILPAQEYLRGLIFTFFKVFGLDIRWFLPSSLRKIMSAYDRADLVVSAPGGPYFGDLYINHELIHWWYVYLAALFNKPLFLYATSAGPFRHKVMNVIRRWLYPKFDLLVVREEISASHIRQLLQDTINVEVTADSAIQTDVKPLERDDYFSGRKAGKANQFLIAVSLLDYCSRSAVEDAGSTCRYNEVIMELLSYVAQKPDVHFMFFPQLYGAIHNDMGFLKTLAKRLPDNTSWEIIDHNLDSDMQRSVFAMCDAYIASRYHPAIFGQTAYIPGLCIYYEHKTLGFMRQLDLERYAFNIDEADGPTLCRAIDDILLNRKEIAEHLHRVIPQLRINSARTTKLAIELLNESVV